MTITELIERLEALRLPWGDLNVGLHDMEWSRCDPLGWVDLVDSNRSTRYPAKDDEALGDRFVLLATGASEIEARSELLAQYQHEEQSP